MHIIHTHLRYNMHIPGIVRSRGWRRLKVTSVLHIACCNKVRLTVKEI